MFMFTDGCAGQYKGRKTFGFISLFFRKHNIEMTHNFAQTAHFKGPHDGLGAVVKMRARRSEDDSVNSPRARRSPQAGSSTPDAEHAFEFEVSLAGAAHSGNSGVHGGHGTGTGERRRVSTR